MAAKLLVARARSGDGTGSARDRKSATEVQGEEPWGVARRRRLPKNLVPSFQTATTKPEIPARRCQLRLTWLGRSDLLLEVEVERLGGGPNRVIVLVIGRSETVD